jgi:hypothetical protein
MSCNSISPITSKIATGFFSVLIHRRCIWNPIKTMIVFGTSILPLIMIPVISIFQQWSDHVFHESLSPNSHIVGNEMWLVLYPIPDELTPYVVISLRYFRKAGKVSMEVMLLHIGYTKGYEYWRHIPREEASLSIKMTTLVSPKGVYSSQVRTLLYDLRKKRIVG